MTHPFLFLCIAGVSCFFSYNLVRMPVLSMFAESLGATPEAIGVVVAASTMTGVFLKLPMGVLSDIYGRKRLLILGAVAFGITPFAYLLIEDLQTLLILRLCHGLATAVFAPIALATVASMFTEKRGVGMGWYTASTQAGALLGPLAGGFFLDHAEFSDAFTVAGVIGLLGLFLVLQVHIADTETTPMTAAKPIGIKKTLTMMSTGVQSVIRNRAVLAASVAGMSKMFSTGILMAFLPLYGFSIGLSGTQIGFLFGIQSAISLASKPLLGRTSDAIGRRPLILLGLALCALAMSGIPFTDEFERLLVLAGIFGFGDAAVMTASAALVGDSTESRFVGSAMGVYGTLSDIGHASGPIMGGILIASVGYPAAFLAAAGIAVTAVAYVGITMTS